MYEHISPSLLMEENISGFICNAAPSLLKSITSFEASGFLEIRLIHQLNMTFGGESVVLHTRPSIFGKFLVRAWRYCGGLNEEHSRSVH